MEDNIAMEAFKQYLQMHEDALTACKANAHEACKDTTRESWSERIKKLHDMEVKFSVSMGNLALDALIPGDHVDPLLLPLYHSMFKGMAGAIAILMNDQIGDLKKETVDDVLEHLFDDMEEA